MVTIYALINPFNNEPFYVGSTRRKLRERLSGHINSGEGNKQRKQLTKLIKMEGLTIEIMPLLSCSVKAAIKCETHIYNLLLKEGYILYQDANRINRNDNRTIIYPPPNVK